MHIYGIDCIKLQKLDATSHNVPVGKLSLHDVKHMFFVRHNKVTQLFEYSEDIGNKRLHFVDKRRFNIGKRYVEIIVNICPF